jgi:redox-sensitive bicupin YhaK (pirin superfamily)
MGIGSLRVFNHDTLAPGAIWPMHPDRDDEGITYVVAGSSSTPTASATAGC